MFSYLRRAPLLRPPFECDRVKLSTISLCSIQDCHKYSALCTTKKGSCSPVSVPTNIREILPLELFILRLAYFTPRRNTINLEFGVVAKISLIVVQHVFGTSSVRALLSEIQKWLKPIFLSKIILELHAHFASSRQAVLNNEAYIDWWKRRAPIGFGFFWCW